MSRISAMAPQRQSVTWCWRYAPLHQIMTCTDLRAIHNAVQRKARPKDKRGKLVSAERLVALGMKLMRQAERNGVIEDLRAYRDGLFIALLAARPMRLGNLAGLAG